MSVVPFRNHGESSPFVLETSRGYSRSGRDLGQIEGSAERPLSLGFDARLRAQDRLASAIGEVLEVATSDLASDLEQRLGLLERLMDEVLQSANLAQTPDAFIERVRSLTGRTALHWSTDAIGGSTPTGRLGELVELLNRRGGPADIFAIAVEMGIAAEDVIPMVRSGLERGYLEADSLGDITKAVISVAAE